MDEGNKGTNRVCLIAPQWKWRYSLGTCDSHQVVAVCISVSGFLCLSQMVVVVSNKGKTACRKYQGLEWAYVVFSGLESVI